MKPLFLDFDGVLNSAEWQAKQVKRDGSFLRRSSDELDPQAVARLNKIIAATGAKVVVSSTWRLLHTRRELMGFLVAAGFRGEIIGMTPRLHVSPYMPTERAVCRGDEIQQWLDWEWERTNLNQDVPGDQVESFVILDDDGDMDFLWPELVQTHFATGLQDEHVARAIEILNAQERPKSP